MKEKTLSKMKQKFNLRVHVRVFGAVARAYSHLGRWEEALNEGQKALSFAEEFSNDSLISYANWALASAYIWKGDFGRAIQYGERALQKAPTPADKALAQRALGWAWCRAGETKRGIELLTDMLHIIQAGRYMPSEITHTCNLGEGYWLAGDNHKAKQTLEKGLKITERCGARYYASWTHRLLGEIAMKTNEEQAVTHFEKSIAVLQEIKAENELALAFTGYGRYFKQKGQLTQAQEYLTKALGIFERLGTIIEPDKVREVLAGLPNRRMTSDDKN